MRFLCILVSLVFSLFLGCGGKGVSESSSHSEAKPIETVVYAGSDWYGHAPVWVGMQKGFFADAGFEVKDMPGGESSDRIILLSTDEAQFSSLGEVAMLTAMDKGEKDFYWIGNQNIAPGGEGLVVQAGINSLADLKGKEVALAKNSSVHLTLADLLAKEGLKLGRDVMVRDAKGQDIVSLLAKGDVQGAIIWEPFFTDLKALPNTKLLATDKDTSFYKEHKTMSGPDMICVSRKWIDANEDRAKRFFKAYFKAVQWCADNPKELIDLVAKRVKKTDKMDEVRTSMAIFQWNGWDQQRTALNNLKAQSESASALLIEMGLLKAAPKVEDWMYFKMYVE